MRPEVAAIAGLAVGILAIFLARKSHLKGWGSLQQIFPDSQVLEGRKFSFSTVSVQPKSFVPFATNYSFCSSVTVSDVGIRLAVPFPFHQPFFIPWSAVVVVEYGDYFLGGKKVLLKTKGFDGNLYFFFGPAKSIYEKWSGQFANA